jgi:hypothetical protein
MVKVASLLGRTVNTCQFLVTRVSHAKWRHGSWWWQNRHVYTACKNGRAMFVPGMFVCGWSRHGSDSPVAFQHFLAIRQTADRQVSFSRMTLIPAVSWRRIFEWNNESEWMTVETAFNIRKKFRFMRVPRHCPLVLLIKIGRREGGVRKWRSWGGHTAFDRNSEIWC